MYNFFSLLILCFLFTSLALKASITTIKGHIPDYKNKTIPILAYSDFITYEADTISLIKVNGQGDFVTEIEVKETTSIFIPLFYYKGLLIIEPGQNYEVDFPPKKEISQGEQLNPFFEPEEVYLNILNLNGRELNTFTRNFDEVIDQYQLVSTNQLLIKGKKSDVDSFIVFMNEKFDLDSLNYFKQHKYYRFARLTNIAYERNNKDFFLKYFAEKPILWHNESYFQTFKTIANNFYGDFSSSEKGALITSNYIKDEDPFLMIQALTSIGQLKSDTLSSIVLLHNIYTRFYKNAIPKDLAIKLINKIAKESKIKKIRTIAQIIYQKFIALLPGSQAPEFQMTDITGKPAQLHLFKGKYIYLHFYNAKSYTARQDLPLLNEMYQRFNSWLEIISIAPKEDLENLQKINKKNEYNWTFLFYEKGNELLKTYKIKTFPSYFLLDFENRFMLSPAPAPTEEFDQIVSKLVIEKERDKIRKRKE